MLSDISAINLNTLIDLVLHLNIYLGQMIDHFGWISYLILFTIVFCETGLVVTPFLPGDSLLFAVGAIAASSKLSLPLSCFCLISGAFLGDQCNYWVGRKLSLFFIKKNLIKKTYLDRTHDFYEKHGSKTLIIARFVPIIRTFAPFVAGAGKMYYPKYLFISIFSAIFWVFSLTILGYLFGNILFVKQNFSLAIAAIIIISIMPAIIIALKARFKKNSLINKINKK